MRRGKIRFRSVVMVLIVLGILMGSADYFVGRADGPVAVSNPATEDRSPTVAVTSGHVIHLAWESPDGVYYRRFEGGVWTAPEQVSVGGEHPRFFVDQTRSDTLYLIWDEPFGDGQDVFIRRWQNGHWGLPRNVSQTDGYSTQPVLAQHADGTLVMVWTDTTPGQPTLYRATSTDGDVWLNVAPLANMVGSEPHLVIVNGIEHLFWMYRASFREPRQLLWSTFDGKSWSLPQVLSGPFSVVSADAAANPASGHLWLLWNESGDIHVNTWNGTAWGQGETLSNNGVDSVAVARPTVGPLALLWVESGKIRRALRQANKWNIQDWWQTSRPITDLSVTTAGDRVYVGWVQQETHRNVWLYAWYPHPTWVPVFSVRAK